MKVTKKLSYTNPCYFKRHRFIKIINELPDRFSLLEVGSAKAPFYNSAKYYKIITDFLAVDIDREPLNHLKNKGLKTLQHDLNKPIPLPNDSFEVIIASEIIEHLYETDLFLSELRRIIKPDGIIILTTPNASGLTERLYMLAGSTKTFEYHTRPGTAGHIRYFDTRKIKEIINYNKLRLIKLKGRDFYTKFTDHNGRLGFINDFLASHLISLSAGFIVVVKK